ncbi:hypothetical protein [Thiocapsa sp.]|uniref:hypothetical protein n=1 Tax=Thiocapsa sp. TaxID=2024551 RepID=UPI00359435A6
MLCQRGFFTRAPDPGGLRQFLRALLDVPLGPAFQQLRTELPHLFDHPILGLTGGAQLIAGVFHQLQTAGNACAQLRVFVQQLQDAGVVALELGAPMRHTPLQRVTA